MPHKDKEAYNAYMKEYMTRRYHKRRAEVVERLGGKCVECAATENLEIDHADRITKEFDVAKMLSGWSWKKIDAELEKCVLRCRKCHELKSILELDHKPARGAHGTLSSYRYCKCDLCKKAMSDYNKEYCKREEKS